MDRIEQSLYSTLNNLQEYYGCSYIYFSLEEILNPKNTFTFQSHPAWFSAYTENHLVEHCPLMIFGKKLMAENQNKVIMFNWNDIMPQNSKQKTVDDARKDFGLFHGFSSSIEMKFYKIMCGFATSEDNALFLHKIIHNPTFFKQNFFNLQQIAFNEIKKLETSENVNKISTY